MSADIPQVDWTNDEAVCRAAIPDIEFCHNEKGDIWLESPSGTGILAETNSHYGGGLSDLWPLVRQRATVVAYEKANRPAVQSPSSEVGAVVDDYPAVACSSCGARRKGSHYNIWSISKGGVNGLRKMFPTAQANEMNVALFSTSGVHGTYTTIEEIEHSLTKYGESPAFAEDENDDAEYPEDYCSPQLTVTVYHPRIIGVGYGVVEVKLEDVPFLKALRQSSWDALLKIGGSNG